MSSRIKKRDSIASCIYLARCPGSQRGKRRKERLSCFLHLSGAGSQGGREQQKEARRETQRYLALIGRGISKWKRAAERGEKETHGLLALIWHAVQDPNGKRCGKGDSTIDEARRPGSQVGERREEERKWKEARRKTQGFLAGVVRNLKEERRERKERGKRREGSAVPRGRRPGS